jgi:hypothetical protein
MLYIPVVVCNKMLLFYFHSWYILAVFGGCIACVVIELLFMLYIPVVVCNKMLLFYFHSW